mmetsp:Transcript_61983/g.164720  ORF Transcript_61983/g.164720 Transcript_61983/m.164720 type:complete len:87 (-) Transcript_61983:13-273(-)
MLAALPPTLPRRLPKPSCLPKAPVKVKSTSGQYDFTSCADQWRSSLYGGNKGHVDGVYANVVLNDVAHLGECSQYNALRLLRAAKS